MRLIRLVRLLVLVLLALLLVAAAMANQGMVTIHLLPQNLADFSGVDYGTQVPLFLVILVSAVVGVVIGYVLEWLREHKHRRAANTGERQVHALAREVSRLRADQGQHKDEVLALLDAPGKR